MNTDVKNLINLTRDLQKQVSQLKLVGGGVSVGNSKKVLVCSAGGETFNKYEVVKVVAGVATEFAGGETLSDEMLPGIVLSGNAEDSTADVMVLVSGIGYVLISSEVAQGADLYVDPGNMRRTSVSASGEAFWKSLEGKDDSDLGLVKVEIKKGGGGGIIRIAEVQSRSEAKTYVVDIYSGWGSDYTLPASKLLFEDVTMKTPNMDDTEVADQLAAGSIMLVVQMTFLTIPEPEGGPEENVYWVPLESKPLGGSCPGSGSHVLMCVDGTLKWVEIAEFVCPPP